MDAVNRAVFLALNASAAPPTALVWFAIVCAKYLYFLVPAHIALVFLGGRRSMRFVAVTGILAMAGALLLSGAIGLAVYTPRPNLLGLGHTLLEHRPSAAFPSNHAIVCFTWAAVLAIFGRAVLALATLALGVLVAWSRVYLGVHFPFDMVGAGAVALVFALAATRVMASYGNPLLDRLDGVLARVPVLRAVRG